METPRGAVCAAGRFRPNRTLASKSSGRSPAGGQAAYVAPAEAFNRGLRALVTDLASRFPRDATVYRTRTRIMTVLAVDPLFAIDAVGPYLYAYRKEIYGLETSLAAVEQFFLENSYDAELRASEDPEKAELVQYFIPKLKECVRGLEPNAKRQYAALVVGLLDSYVEYLAARLGQK